MSPLKGIFLHELHLEDNDLTEINHLNPSNFPFLTKLSISKNHLSCEFLEALTSNLNEWQGIVLIGDVWNQKHSINCTAVKQRTTDLNILEFVSAPQEIDNLTKGSLLTVTKPMPTLWMNITIGILFLSVVVIGIVCVIFRESCFRRRTSNENYEPRTLLEREEEMKIALIPNELSEIPTPIYIFSLTLTRFQFEPIITIITFCCVVNSNST